jgi:hypothetical protein
LPGDVVKERINNRPVNIRIIKCPGKPLAPTQGPRPPGPPAGGKGSKEPSNQREPPHLPFFPLSITGEVGG